MHVARLLAKSYTKQMQLSHADAILKQVTTDYDAIASHFASTRSFPWPEFAFLQPLLKPNLNLLDVGCGSGRLAEDVPSDVRYTGVDVSEQLLKIAQIKYPQHQFVPGSMLALPFPDSAFDITTAVASLQHIPSDTYRLKAVQELARVTKPGGHVFLINWNMTGSYFEPHRAPQDQDFDDNDFLMPWRNEKGEQLALRYYHGFTQPELQNLCEQAGLQLETQRCTVGSRNCLTIARK